MKFHAPTGALTVDRDGLQSATHGLLFAMRKIRKLAGLPLDKHERPGPLSDADQAQKAIIDAAAALGIDLGAQWGNELDLRDSN